MGPAGMSCQIRSSYVCRNQLSKPAYICLGSVPLVYSFSHMLGKLEFMLCLIFFFNPVESLMLLYMVF